MNWKIVEVDGELITPRDPKNKKERAVIEHAKRLYDSAMKKQEVMVNAMRASRSSGR